MKKILLAIAITMVYAVQAQESANRFFYELQFKPKKEKDTIEMVMTILDITGKQSIYQDYTVIAQDSIIEVEVEKMKQSGVMKDLSKSINQPKFSGKTYKKYPSMEIEYVEQIMSGFTPTAIAYDQDLKLNWNISTEKKQIGTYQAQKATTDFGGRKWIAWFTDEIPINDGPYKFHGLPGLIVKIHDDKNNYSWELKGNKKIDDYSEYSYIERMMKTNVKPLVVSRKKFDKTFGDFQKDPFATMRPNLTPEMLKTKMPGTNKTLGQMFNEQEKKYKEFYESNNNPIELTEN